MENFFRSDLSFKWENNVKQYMYLDVLTQFNVFDNHIKGQGQRLMLKFKAMLIILVNLIIMIFDLPY